MLSQNHNNNYSQSYRPIVREQYWLLMTPPPSRSPSHPSPSNTDHTQTAFHHSPSSSCYSIDSSNFSYTDFMSPSDKILNQMPSSTKVKCKRLRKTVIQEHQCSICLEIIRDKAQLPCGHSYCHACLKEWLGNAARCPYCRSEVTSYNYGGQTHKVAPKQFKYEPTMAEILDWSCYRCNHTQQGDVILICDRCQAYACHIECDQSLGGVEPAGEWYCHYCR